MLLRELLSYFGCTSGSCLPPPPWGLPGTTVPDEDDRDPVLKALGVGFAYFLAIVDREPRSQANRFEEMRSLLSIHYLRGRNDSDALAEARYSDQIETENRKRWVDGEFQTPTDKSLVYFIASANGPIKIGIANDIEQRLRGLQTANPVALRLLASRTGGRAQEQEYHKRFAAHRLHGEWFDQHPDILAEIERLNG